MMNDPYKYFRIEARELLEALTQGVLELEKGNFSKDRVGRLLRHAHTLKGAARIVNQSRVSELSHAIEDLLSPHRQGAAPVPRERVTELLGLVDQIAGVLGALEPAGPQAEPATVGPPRPVEEPFETVRIEIGEMDAFLHEASQAGVHLTALKQGLAGFDEALRIAGTLVEQTTTPSRSNGRSARGTPLAEQLRTLLRRLHQTLLATSERTERELSRVQDRAADLRLLPASTVFGSLERAARDAAESLAKKIDFQTSGGENRLDTHVLRALRDALVHVVRNAVAHGIEPQAQRLAAGKPAAGRVKLTVERRASRVVFICEDDGRGIDVEQVRRAAIERGWLSPSDSSALEPQEAVGLLLRGGVTTTKMVTQVSGRGVGLDVVRETMTRLKGQVSATSEPSRGTTIVLSVPVSLESLTVLEVEVAGSIVSVPFDATLRSLRVAKHQIARSAEGDSILFEGKAIPFAPLVTLLRPGLSPAPQPRFWSVLIIQADSRLTAIAVDRVLRTTRVVLRPLPRLAGRIEPIAGASFDSAGNPQLMIDPMGVAQLIARGAQAVAEAAAVRKLPLLVIDDSLTTRMLEQSILETAGYEVDLAVSGEEALKKARQRRYAMFVVDIEMPGIDGFEFIERVQADPQLREIPSILVTSRASIEDRRRGEQVGARAYIVKSEFDEGQLLGTIRSLIG